MRFPAWRPLYLDIWNEKLWMTCAYGVQNPSFQHTRLRPDSLRSELAGRRLVWDYPLGAADDCALACGEHRQVPAASSQSGSTEVVIRVGANRLTDGSL